jgi:hypothetical protein
MKIRWGLSLLNTTSQAIAFQFPAETTADAYPAVLAVPSPDSHMLLTRHLKCHLKVISQLDHTDHTVKEAEDASPP